MQVKTKLVMSFKGEDGKRVSLSVDDPRINLTEAEVVAAMDIIVEKNVFAPGGVDIVEAIEANIVRTETTGYDLVVE